MWIYLKRYEYKWLESDRWFTKWELYINDRFRFYKWRNTVSLGTINGIINGNDHTISNINFTNNTPLIGYLYGTFENLYINNFKQEVTANGGLVYRADLGATVDNVHLSNVNILKTGGWTSGSLVRSSYSSLIRNCSANNVRIIAEGSQAQMYLGGLVGALSNSTLENCYTKGVSITDSKGCKLWYWCFSRLCS